MNRLYIITQATSKYNDYLPFLFKSLSNIRLSTIWELHMIVLSDNKPDFSLVPENIKSISYSHISHLPYAFNVYLKLNYIYDYIMQYQLDDNDYIMYVDTDTIFRYGNYYQKIESDLLSNKMIFSISPWYNDIYNVENNIVKEHCPSLYIRRMEKIDFLQSSFWAGRIQAFKIFFKNEYERIQIELIRDWRDKKIPPMTDQSVINYVVWKNKRLYIKDNYVFNIYQNITLDKIDSEFQNIKSCNNTINIDDCPNIFLIQKFNTYIKNSIRLSIAAN